MELYQKCLDVFETLAREQATVQNRRDLVIGYNRVGEVYEALGGRANLERALGWYQKGLECSEVLAREQGTAERRRDLSVSYNHVGDVYQVLGGRANLEQALERYQKGPVSYTHLDVYKRQMPGRWPISSPWRRPL